MPIYEYRCESCGAEFELIQKFSDDPAGACRECGGAVSRLISRSAIQFKGSGWYITDYARKSSAASEKPGATKAGGEGSSGKEGGPTASSKDGQPAAGAGGAPAAS